jgi:hypothetical protein
VNQDAPGGAGGTGRRRTWWRWGAAVGVFVGLHVLASPFALLWAYGAVSTAAIVLAPVRPLPAGSVTATVL